MKGWLADQLRVDDSDKSMLRRLLLDVALTDTLADAFMASQQAPELTFVTLKGHVLTPDGTLIAGREDSAGGHLIELKREISGLEKEVRTQEGSTSRALTQLESVRASIAAAQTTLDEAREQVHETAIGVIKAEEDLKRTEGAAQTAGERRTQLREDIAELESRQRTAAGEQTDLRNQLDEFVQALETARQDLAQASDGLGTHRSRVESHTALVTQLQVRAAQAHERAEGDRGALERLERSIEELNQRHTQIEADLTQLAAQQGEAYGLIRRARETLSDRVREAMASHATLNELKERYEEARQRIGEREVDLRDLRKSIDTIRERVSTLTLRERELSLALQHLVQSVLERHRVDLQHVIGDYHASPSPDGETQDTHRRTEPSYRADG